MRERMTIKTTIILFFFFIFGAMIQYSGGSAFAGDPAGYVKEGKNLLENGDYQTGVQTLAKAVSEGGTQYRAETLDIMREATDSLFKTEDTASYAKVKKLLEYAFEFDFYKNSEMLHNQMGSVFRKTGMISEAIAEYAKALEIAPDYAPSRFNLALCYFKQNEFQKSYQELNKIPESASLYQVAQEKKNLLLKNFNVRQS